MAAGLNGILRGVQGDLRGAIIELSGEGWTPSKTSGGHIRLDHPEAAKPVFAASTPSDFRSPDNLRRDCRGALRAPLQCRADPISEEEAMSTLQSHKAKRKSRKRRSGFIEMAGQRVAAQISQEAQEAQEQKPKTGKVTAKGSRKGAPKPVKHQITTITTSGTETRDMKMTNDITPAEGPVTSAPVTPALAETVKAAAKPSGKPKARKVGAADAPAGPRAESDAIALGIQIGMRIASGELMQVAITPDMVGKTLIMERGEIHWVNVAPQKVGTVAKKGGYRKNARFNDAIIALLDDLKGEEVPVSLIADHMIEKGFYKPRSARPGVCRRLAQLREEGRVVYRDDLAEPCATHLS